MSGLQSELSPRIGAPIQGGYVSALRGLLAEVRGLDLPVGGLTEIEVECGRFVPAEIVGFHGDRLELMGLADFRGVSAGCRVWPRARDASVPAGDFLLGRVVDPMGAPIDHRPAFPIGDRVPIYRHAMDPLNRPVLEDPLDVGVNALNALTTFARGQRVGLFAGAGVGKSSLMGMMVRGTDADVRVVALIGERGREVREFIERELGRARRSTVVVAAPADASPLLRVRGAYVATAIAEYFRDRGAQVLLLMDSLTRFAMAAREIGLARGEPTTTKGYTPSVFAELPALLERAGRQANGSITGVYTVLVEGDDLDDPIADALRAILDGHVVLSRDLAERGHFPAVDPLASVSRAMEHVVPAEHKQLATKVRRLLAAYRDAQDLIQVGAYAAGSDKDVDQAIALRASIEAFLCQDLRTQSTLGSVLPSLRKVFSEKAA